eukprot:Hpha_TRINITY_DN22671_c0_g1::TRINITY_DN22671_c0_g1_i1::g.192658::m.192658
MRGVSLSLLAAAAAVAETPPTEGPCTIKVLDRIPEKWGTTDEPYVVRGIPNPVPEWTAPMLAQRYSKQQDHYDKVRKGRDGKESREDDTVTVESAYAKRKKIAAMQLEGEDAGRVRELFKPTFGESGAKTMDRGVIVGQKGMGVLNDFHQEVWFFHLHGRKKWVFTRKELRIGTDDRCGHDLTQYGHYCMLGPGDFLFAPKEWYHTTCHMDDETATIIQWDDAELRADGAYGGQEKARPERSGRSSRKPDRRKPDRKKPLFGSGMGRRYGSCERDGTCGRD